MSDLSKVDIATVHLKYKIENANTFERFANLGFMTVEGVSETILNDIYSIDDVAAATVGCVASAHLDAFYLVRCLTCKGVSYVNEVDIARSETLLELINDGPPCHHCSAKLSQDPKSVDLRFAIPQRFIPDIEGGHEKLAGESPLKRLMRWLGLRK